MLRVYTCTINNALEKSLLALGETDGVAAEVVSSVVLPEEGLLRQLQFHDRGQDRMLRLRLTSPTIHRGPTGSGMSIAVKDEMQVPPALRT